MGQFFDPLYLSPFRETLEHGANFIEPPPDIIDGELEWEVERIIGTRLYGRKKERQYQIHWKGYSAAHDTWEPASNIHAPELIQQFLQLPPDTIRAVQLGPEDVRMNPDFFREGLFEEPGRRPLATLSSCHRRYCSALDIGLIAEDVRFVLMCLHSRKALRCVAAQDRCINRTCSEYSRVRLEWYRNAYTGDPNI